jgi:hypothetical protein
MTRYILIYIALVLVLVTNGVAGVESSTPMQKAIRTLSPGQSLTYDNQLNFAPTAPYTIIPSGPPLVMSDDPERVYASGILTQESVGAGTSRIYFYNIKYTPSDDFKITVVLKNLSTETGHITILRRGADRPGNYYLLGKTNLYSFYTSDLHTEIPIAPLASAILDSLWETNYATGLTHGFYEIYAQQSTQVTICGLPFTSNTLETYESLTVISAKANNAGRGLFPNSDRKITLKQVVDTKNGIHRVPLADWGVNDPWIMGVDGLSGRTVANVGNYGVMYSVNLPMRSTDNRDMAVMMMCPVANPGACPFGGVIGTNTFHNQSPAGFYYTPSDLKSFTNTTTASLIGIYSLSKTPVTISLQFSPPGGSCLPGALLLVPIEKSNRQKTIMTIKM